MQIRGALAPYESKQYETGVKVDLGRITTAAAIFQIERPSAQVNTAIGVYGYFGEQRNRSVELSAYGELKRGLRSMANVTFLDAELTRTTPDTDNGNDAPGVPDTTASLGLDWDTPIAGVALNGRAI